MRGANTRGLVGKSNQLFAALLAHLAEVEARGLHRTRACASLYTYCIYELRFSEDAAARRAGAAKLVKRFPQLLDAIANGELHLTGLLMLGPHLTAENIVEVLGRAKFRTKKELAKLLRELHPLPLVPDLIEPLRPDPAPLRRPTWQEFVSSFAPAVRELPPGERPRDWVDGTNDTRWPDARRAAPDCQAEGGVENGGVENGGVEDAEIMEESVAEGGGAEGAASFLHALARVEPVTGPQQYQVQFSTTEEHVALIERAKSLLMREAPGKSLGELHLEAMRLLVASLEKRKFAVTERPRKTTTRRQSHQAPPRSEALPQDETLLPVEVPPCDELSRPREEPLPRQDPPSRQASARRRGRYVSAEVRRVVFERDGGRCSFVDDRGERCRETRYLELHHRHPFGKRGDHSIANLTLHCRTHNALAAELDYGRAQMAARRDARHESVASENRRRAREEALARKGVISVSSAAKTWRRYGSFCKGSAARQPKR